MRIGEASTQGARDVRRASGQRVANPVLPGLVGNEVDQVGLAEVAVVVGLFLHAHRRGRAEILVPVARLLTNGPASFEQFDLALRLEVDRALETAQRVQVLDLAARPEGSPGLRTETLASMRIEPSSMRPSDAPVAIRMPRSSAA